MAVPTNVLSLCAGGGGLDLGIRRAVRGARTVCYVENEVTACGVLAARMEDGGLDLAPIWTDLRTFDGRPWRGVVDLSRAEQLHILGNGVVPEQAAYAFAILADALETDGALCR